MEPKQILSIFITWVFGSRFSSGISLWVCGWSLLYLTFKCFFKRGSTLHSNFIWNTHKFPVEFYFKDCLLFIAFGPSTRPNKTELHLRFYPWSPQRKQLWPAIINSTSKRVNLPPLAPWPTERIYGPTSNWSISVRLEFSSLICGLYLGDFTDISPQIHIHIQVCICILSVHISGILVRLCNLVGKTRTAVFGNISVLKFA